MGAGSVQPGALVGQRLGKYDLLALLAIGGSAEIYLARIGGEAGFEKYVVVKCLLDHLADDAEFVRMFLDEARLSAQLDHSNIVQTLELGEQSGRYYMVMEYLAGLSLSQVARKAHERLPGRLIPLELVLGLAAQACSGLHYAHQRSSPDGTQLNVVHRDISPQNLVISFEGVLKIVDFGIAKADVRQTHTQDGTIKGKFAYMSPEQCLAKPIDRRTDIFALGVIIHELLTGRRLFKRSTTYETYQAIVNGKVPKPSAANPHIEPKLDALVMKALEYDRSKRYPNAETFGEALLGYLHGRGKSVSASDVSQFFEAHFATELDEHAARMRALIEGRARTATENLTWDNSVDVESGSEKKLDTLDLGAREKKRREEAGEDEGEGGTTRIELNPLSIFESQGQDRSREAIIKNQPRAKEQPTVSLPAPPSSTPAGASPGLRPGAATPPERPGPAPLPGLRPGATTPPERRTPAPEPARGTDTTPPESASPPPSSDNPPSAAPGSRAGPSAPTAFLASPSAIPAGVSPAPGNPQYRPEAAPRAEAPVPPDTISGATPPPAPPPSGPHPSAFPPIETPSPLAPHAAAHQTGGVRSVSPPAGAEAPPFWLLALAFLVAAGVGLGATVLIVKLVA